jgi:outer membrane protein TolC
MKKNLNYKRLISISFLLVASLMLSGCSTLLPRSQYTRPEASLPNQWQEATVTGTTIAASEKWWQDFNDPTLNDLIERALGHNNLAAATIRVCAPSSLPS